MKLKNGQRIVFIGDSVTDTGRERPVAEGLFNPLGNGYVHIISGLLAAVYPELDVRVTNMGCSGNTVRDLAARWQTDVFDLAPDWLSVMIGINDVWRQFDVPQLRERHVSLEEYASTLEKLVTETLPRLAGGLVLMTPYYIETSREDAMRARMDEYGAVCRELAAKYSLPLVDTQAGFDRLLKHHHSSFIAWDRVHPNNYGHTMLAREFLKTLEFDFNHMP